MVAGYGWVGRGIASRMSGHGAHVTVVEIDPVRALEALMDGYQVMTVGQAAGWGDLFVTATGNINVFRREHFAAMHDGAIMANSGHFDAELDLAALREMAEGHVREVRENVQEFDIGGKRLNLVAEGRLVNLGAAEGHPAAVMDMSFANQALSAEYVAQHHAELEPKVYVVPDAIDAEVARLKLAAMGITLDAMTPEQLDVRVLLAAGHMTAFEGTRPTGPSAGATVAPYGSWRSPIEIDLVAGSAVSLAEPWLDGPDIYWLEGRPAEGGRRTLLRRTPDGAIRELTPAPFAVGNRVHEYGGGSYVAGDGRVIVSSFSGGQLWSDRPRWCRRPPAAHATGAVALRGSPVRPGPAGALRRARGSRPGGRSAGPRPERLVAIALDGSDGAGRRHRGSGADFVAAPRPSPDGRSLAWLEWDLPDMPWDATRLRVADLLPDGALDGVRTVAGGPGVSIVQPALVGGRRAAPRLG